MSTPRCWHRRGWMSWRRCQENRPDPAPTSSTPNHSRVKSKSDPFSLLRKSLSFLFRFKEDVHNFIISITSIFSSYNFMDIITSIDMIFVKLFYNLRSSPFPLPCMRRLKGTRGRNLCIAPGQSSYGVCRNRGNGKWPFWHKSAKNRNVWQNGRRRPVQIFRNFPV